MINPTTKKQIDSMSYRKMQKWMRKDGSLNHNWFKGETGRYFFKVYFEKLNKHLDKLN